jgi:hypothetical protein
VAVHAIVRVVFSDPPRIWGEETWPPGPWNDITIAPGEESVLVGVDGGVVEIEIATGRVLRTHPERARSPSHASSIDGLTTVTHLGTTLEVKRATDGATTTPPIVLPLGSRVWPSPDGALLLVCAPWDGPRNRDGIVTLLRWSDRATLRALDTGGGASVVSWIDDRVVFVDRHRALHVWDASRAVRATVPGQAVAVMPVTCDGERLLLVALHRGRHGRTELRSVSDGSLVRVLSETASLSGAVTSDGRLVTPSGRVVSLRDGETLVEHAQGRPIDRVVISPRADRALIAQADQVLLVDLVRWERVCALEEVRSVPGYAFAGGFLPDGERMVLVTGGRVVLLDAEGRVQWTRTLGPDPAWSGAWELPPWSNTCVQLADDAMVIEAEWIQRGHVDGDGHQDYEGRARRVVLDLEGNVVERDVPAAAPAAFTASCERRGQEHERVVVRKGDEVVCELDVALAHGTPRVAAIAGDGSLLVVGTKRGLLLAYR